jgi:hypothetical protein
MKTPFKITIKQGVDDRLSTMTVVPSIQLQAFKTFACKMLGMKVNDINSIKVYEEDKEISTMSQIKANQLLSMVDANEVDKYLASVASVPLEKPAAQLPKKEIDTPVPTTPFKVHIMKIYDQEGKEVTVVPSIKLPSFKLFGCKMLGLQEDPNTIRVFTQQHEITKTEDMRPFGISHKNFRVTLC